MMNPLPSSSPSAAIQVTVTFPSLEEAQQMAEFLVKERWVACAQLNEIQSLYIWEDRMCHEAEIRLTLKTRMELFDELCVQIQQRHSYQIPEIAAIPIIRESEGYGAWIISQTRRPAN